MDPEIGTLERDRLGLSPVIDPVKTVVSQANAADVDSVFLAGEPVKRDGKMLNVDLASIVERLSAANDHILTESRKHDTSAVIEMIESVLPLG